MNDFAAEVVAGVTEHMNGDHLDDSLLIVRAFGYPDATASRMTGVTGEAGVWQVTDPAGEHEATIAWPGAPISERPQIRRQVVELYKAACKQLGIDPREEHEPSADAHAHGAGHAHGAAHGHDAAAADDTADKPFSRVLREGSWSDHSDSEGATFMEDIMRGNGTLQDYVDLAVQHFFMYEALEEAAAKLDGNPAFEGFHSDDLLRLATLEADLTHLIGDDWRDKIEAVPATLAYAARMREVGEEGWVAGVVAHHYTRYLGDLSGGQIIAKRVSRQHGFEAAGIEFYDFSALGDLATFKDQYRVALDRLGAELSDDERERMLDEVRAAYGFNTAVFIDLGRAKAKAQEQTQA